MKKVGRVGGKGLLYFEIVTTLALIIGVLVAHFIQPGAGVAVNNTQADKVATYTSQAKDLNWVDFFTHIIPNNIFKSFAEGDILQILFFSILFGAGLSRLGSYGSSLVATFEKISKVIFKIMKMIMWLAPLGLLAVWLLRLGNLALEVCGYSVS
jgi:aerobic C4-dicarboxylate transport protein